MEKVQIQVEDHYYCNDRKNARKMGKGSIYQEIFFLKVFSHMNRKLLHFTSQKVYFFKTSMAM